MSDPIDISKLPTFMLREIVAGETKPQPEEVKPCAAPVTNLGPEQSNPTAPSTRSTRDAAPQGFNPPAGAAVQCTCRPELLGSITNCPVHGLSAPQPPGGTPEVDWMSGEVPESCPFCAAGRSVGMKKKTGLTCVWWEYRCGTKIYDNRTLPKYKGLLDVNQSLVCRAGTKHRVLKEQVATLERQRNEARAALAAALAEVEALRKERNNALAILKGAEYERLDELKGGTPREWRKIGEMVKNITIAFKDARDEGRAELEQTRRELLVAQKKNETSLANNLCPDHRDKQRGKPCLACEIETLTRRLTAAEQRAEGAEKERAKLGDVLEKWFPDITSPHAFPIERAIYLLRLYKLAKADIAALTAQRDTAQRERDEARKDTARLDWMQLRKPLLRWDMENGWYVRSGSTPHADSSIRAAIDAALAAKTTEGGERP